MKKTRTKRTAIFNEGIDIGIDGKVKRIMPKEVEKRFKKTRTIKFVGEDKFVQIEEEVNNLRNLLYKLSEDFLVHIQETKVGVDDSEEVGFTKGELTELYYLAYGHYGTLKLSHDGGETCKIEDENIIYWRTLADKLNKMLKETSK